MKEHAISRLAIYILAIVLIIFGIYHFMRPQNLVVYIPDFLPGGNGVIYVVGGAYILAGLAFILHKQVKLAGYLLAILLVGSALSIHLYTYMNAGDKDLQQASFINFLKDIALAAFALFIASNTRHNQIERDDEDDTEVVTRRKAVFES